MPKKFHPRAHQTKKENERRITRSVSFDHRFEPLLVDKDGDRDPMRQAVMLGILKRFIRIQDLNEIEREFKMVMGG